MGSAESDISMFSCATSIRPCYDLNINFEITEIKSLLFVSFYLTATPGCFLSVGLITFLCGVVFV